MGRNIKGTLTDRSGQAMAELMVGLVALLVLFGGLLQVISLSRAHTDTLVKARRDAARAALQENLVIAGSPEYIRDWQVGPDTRRYTPDDTHTHADPLAFQNVIVEHAAAQPTDWTLIDQVLGNNFTRLHSSPNPVSCFGLVRGENSETVVLLPLIRNLVYDASQVDVRSTVWMSRMKGIY